MVRTKMYRDRNDNAIPGYPDFTMVEVSRLMTPDQCCMKACEDEPFNFLLPGCPDRRVSAGVVSYSIESEGGWCSSTQTDTIGYFLIDGTE